MNKYYIISSKESDILRYCKDTVPDDVSILFETFCIKDFQAKCKKFRRSGLFVIPLHEKIRAPRKPRKPRVYKPFPTLSVLQDRAVVQIQNENAHEILFKELLGSWEILYEYQEVLHSYIVDFYIPEISVVIEIDGSSHKKRSSYDVRRDKFLNKQGIYTIRIITEDLYNPELMGSIKNRILDLISSVDK